MMDLSPERWAALRAVNARIQRLDMRLTTLRVDGAALALDILEHRLPARPDPELARHAFHVATDSQAELVRKPGLADEPEYAPTVARLPAMIDLARAFIG